MTTALIVLYAIAIPSAAFTLGWSLRYLLTRSQALLLARERHALELQLTDQVRYGLELRRRLTRATVVVHNLRRGDCWCEVAIGNPMLSVHTPACAAACDFEKEQGPLGRWILVP